MSLTSIVYVVLVLAASLVLVEWSRRRRKRLFLASHSINAEQLKEMLAATSRPAAVQVLDVRQPLDLLAYSQIIPGSRRVPPKEILEHPDILPKDQETVVYCTCPSDDTAAKIMQKAIKLGYLKVRILTGGLDAWKAKGYPVEPYRSSFHLDTPL